MSSEIETGDIVFYRSFNRTMLGFAVLCFFYLSTITSIVLIGEPVYWHDWRGVACVGLSIVAFLLYAIHTLFNSRRQQSWPPSLRYALSMWSGMYLSVFLLVLIDHNFVWNFYMVFGLCFGLFSSRRLLLMVSLIALTIFAFQGLLTWPVNAVGFFNIISQTLAIYSLTCMSMLFQKLIAERFTRERLFQELQHANTRLEEANRRLEQSVVQEQELAVLRERTRLAREMHDTLGHALVLISVKLEAAQRLRARDPERCDQELESTKAIARESMAGLRASIADLRSPVLERERFQQALERSVSELRRRAGLHVTYTLQVDMTSLSAPLEEVLWKVSQEALTNIEKHAHATHVDLRIGQRADQLTLLIRDDGIGLPGAYYTYHEDGHLVCLSAEGHYGLRGMLERVEHAGGRFAVRSAPGEGTTIEATLPLRAIEKQVDDKKAQEAQL
ncbi:sensor histidine kinase [Dictyobacter aurantiacus]|uniref:Uncharacterized protein n=1 Tax=Dictyobacter aurantiacus TaxID=1936993 RepID=A0A401ZP86_9CHLR|nr:sensor histidine kinase [Dictyobacter aurantiacus]GCE08671.1 hypothetical protein KDAU_60000 [Dictyobacter aurantiacus]